MALQVHGGSSLLRIRMSNRTLYCCHVCGSGRRPNSFIAALLPNVPYRPAMNLTAWFWTISGTLISLCCWGHRLQLHILDGIHREICRQKFGPLCGPEEGTLDHAVLFLAVTIFVSMFWLFWSVTPRYSWSALGFSHSACAAALGLGYCWIWLFYSQQRWSPFRTESPIH